MYFPSLPNDSYQLLQNQNQNQIIPLYIELESILNSYMEYYHILSYNKNGLSYLKECNIL